jgi:trimeric autotransporter adhesin
MLTVTLVETSTRVTSSRNPAELGQVVVYTADVVSNPGSGTVTFTARGLPIEGCTAVGINPSSGTATCATSYFTAGAQRIGATFSGNAAFAASSAATAGVLALTETVDAAVAVPTTGAGPEGNPAEPLAGGVLAFLGLLTVVGARRLRSQN